jgi:uncharacterized protein YkwD
MGAASAVPIVLAAVLGLAPPAAARQSTAASRSVEQLEQSFFRAVNALRVRHDLQPLVLDERLRATARSHTRDMIRRGYFAHRNYAQRIAGARAPGNWVGEVLGWTVDRDDAVPTIVELWLESPTHRAIVLSPAARRMGIGVVRGHFMGRPVADVITTDFQGWIA